MRLFAALPLPDVTRQAVAQLQDTLKADGWPIRWIAAENLHVTLQFLGEVDASLEAPLARALDTAAAGEAPVPLSVRALEAIPNARQCRLLWLALDAPAALEFIADRFARECAREGLTGGDNAFRPHITLGRIKDGGRLPGSAARRLDAVVLPQPFVSDALVLFQSDLSSGPPRYIARHVRRLGG